MYKFISSILLIISCFQSIICTEVKCMEKGNWEKGNLYINQKLINNGDDVLIRGNEVLFPLRTIFENLGATVDWDEETQNLSIDYNHNKYLCELEAAEPASPDMKYIHMIDISNNKYLILTQMSTGGMCTIIDDRIYLYRLSGEILFETMGCAVDIDVEQRILKIYSPSGVGVTLNGTPMNFDVTPKIENDHVLVPMRAIFEALGAQVDWEEETKTAVAQKDGIELRIQIDSDTMYKNGEPIRLDTPSRLIDDSTLVPIRAVSESFGAKVEWNEENKMVMISTEE